MSRYDFSFSPDVAEVVEASTPEFKSDFSDLLAYLDDNPFPRGNDGIVVPSKDDLDDFAAGQSYSALFDHAWVDYDVSPHNLIKLISITPLRPAVLPDLAE